jgi:arginine decarboxylase
MNLPKEMFFTTGIGHHKDKLTSFELALRDANIAQFNIVRVSSIFPPYCKIISKEEGLAKLQAGQIVFSVLSDIGTNEFGRMIAASIGVAIPNDQSLHGYLSEYHEYGKTQEEVGDYAEDIAAYMIATILTGSKEEIDWDAAKEIWKMQSNIVKTQNTSVATKGYLNGSWTTALAGAILVG